MWYNAKSALCIYKLNQHCGICFYKYFSQNPHPSNNNISKLHIKNIYFSWTWNYQNAQELDCWQFWFPRTQFNLHCHQVQSVKVNWEQLSDTDHGHPYSCWYVQDRFVLKSINTVTHRAQQIPCVPIAKIYKLCRKHLICNLMLLLE